jgi:eukaryotic-like serine/threonine-protein kinase
MQSNCPAEEQLLAFHFGTLPDSEVDALAEHLERCALCETALQRLDKAVDPLLSALRKPVPTDSTLLRDWGNSKASGSDLQAPENWPRLPDYEILGVIGRGGMGVVYKARDLRLNRLVALKRFRLVAGGQQERSRIEANALSRLQHPNIVQIHELHEQDGETFLVLELVNGGSLAAKLRGRPQPPRESALLLETIARAIHYAHGYGIVHRDLKPANILLKDERKRMKEDNDADAPTPSAVAFVLQPHSLIPKISDFGVAKRLAVDSGETREGDVIGTPAYMAPEQATGKNDRVGPATDVYSLGVILYELLTGRVPLQGPTTLETLILVRTEEPVAPRRLVPRIPYDLETICLKCLEKEPTHRYASAEELAKDLRRFQQEEPIVARPTPAWERGWKWVRRRPLVAILSGTLAVVTLLGFILVASQWQRAESKAVDEAKARREAQENERLEKVARRQLEKVSASMTLSHGLVLCDKGQMDHGLLWLVRALQRAERAEDPDLERAARYNLASWLPFLVRSRGEFVHTSWVWSVAFSPDGRQAVSASVDANVQRLDPATAQPVGEPLHHPLPVWIAVYSPDSKKILTVCSELNDPKAQARIWDAASGKEMLVLPPMEGGRLVLAAFRPDGQTFLAVLNRQIRLWRTSDGEPAGEPFRHPPAANANPKFQPKVVAALRPDGAVLATAGEDATIRLWDPVSGKQQGEPLHADGPVTAIAYSPDGETLVTGSVRGAVQIWNPANGQQHGPILRQSGQIRVIAFSPDGECVAAGGAVVEVDPERRVSHLSGGEVRLWRTASGQQLGGPLPHSMPVWSLAFTPNGRILLTGCENGTAHFFVVATGQQIGTPLGHPGNVVSVAISPDGKTALTSSAGGGTYQVAHFWEVLTAEAVGQQFLQSGQIQNLAVNSDNRLFVTTADDGKVRFWGVHSGRLLNTVALPEQSISQAAFSRDGRKFLTSNATPNDSNLQLWIWDPATQSAEKKIPMEHPFSAAFCPDSRTILVSPLDEPLQVFAEDGSPQQKGKTPKPERSFWAMLFSPDGRMLLTRDGNGFQLWDPVTFERLHNWREGMPTACLFYPDSKRLLLVVRGFPHCWDSTTGNELALPKFHADGGFVKGVFSPDGGQILTVNSDRVARLWDVATGQTLGPPLGRYDASLVAFSSDGRKLISAGQHGRLALWDVPNPLPGDSERLRLWIEVLTGLKLDEDDAIHPLTADALRQRRQRLETLGGPLTR